MLIRCADCGLWLNDLWQSTACPHEQFITPEAAERKDRAVRLCIHAIEFRDRRDGWIGRIMTVDFEGMVTVSGHGDQIFEPELFREATTT